MLLAVLLAGCLLAATTIAGVALLMALPTVGDARGGWPRSCGSTGVVA